LGRRRRRFARGPRAARRWGATALALRSREGFPPVLGFRAAAQLTPLTAFATFRQGAASQLTKRASTRAALNPESPPRDPAGASAVQACAGRLGAAAYALGGAHAPQRRAALGPGRCGSSPLQQATLDVVLRSTTIVPTQTTHEDQHEDRA
jgi:hypothetical protein